MKTLLKPEQLNSKLFKKELMEHLFYRLNFSVVVDEHNFMDVFGIRRSGYMVEFEVKISKSDLMREIKLMKCDQVLKYSKDWPKWEKHAWYLGRTIEKIPNRYGFITQNIDPPYFIPNEFYFYVPDFLAEVALQETASTPYGVVSIGERYLPASGNSIFSSYVVHRQAKKLHSEKVNPAIFREVAQELTVRNRIFH